MLDKNIFGQTFVVANIILRPTFVLGPTYLKAKTFGAEKFFGEKKFCCNKNFVEPKKFGTKIFWDEIFLGAKFFFLWTKFKYRAFPS